MSHTFFYECEGHPHVCVIVNSDWSGDASVRYGTIEGGNLVMKEATLPGEILQAIFKHESKRLAINAFAKVIGFDDECV